MKGKQKTEYNKVYDGEVEEVVKEKPIRGRVDCGSLNVREEPSTKSNILKVISRDSWVTIIDHSDPRFYKVELKDDISGKYIYGYCVREFIQLR